MADTSHLQPPQPAAPAVRDQVRIRFRKGGDLRWLSHHDLMRLLERLLRRAALPVHQTQGFHPHPRLILALALPVGVVGCEEVAELELDDVLPLEQIEATLHRHAPPGLDILSVHRVGLKARAQVRTLGYRIALPPERLPAVTAAIEQLLTRPVVEVRRVRARAGDIPLTAAEDDTAGARVNIRPYLRRLEVCADSRLSLRESTPFRSAKGDTCLEFDLWLTPAGTARPTEVLALLGLTDLLDAGAVLERARLELHDEASDDEAHSAQTG